MTGNQNPLLQLLQAYGLGGITPSIATPPIIPRPAGMPGPMPGGVALPPAIAPTAAQPAPQPPPKKRGFLDKLTDPRAAITFSNIASTLAAPRAQGQSELGQFVNAFSQGLGTLAMMSELDRRRAIQDYELVLKGAETGSQIEGRKAQAEALTKNAATSATATEAEITDRRERGSREERKFTYEQGQDERAFQQRQEQLDAERAFREKEHKTTVQWRTEQLRQAKAELAEKREQFDLELISREQLAQAERENRTRLANIQASAQMQSAALRNSASEANARDELALLRLASANVIAKNKAAFIGGGPETTLEQEVALLRTQANVPPLPGATAPQAPQGPGTPAAGPGASQYREGDILQNAQGKKVILKRVNGALQWVPQ